MNFEFTPVVGDVDMSWEIPQPATGDWAGLPVGEMDDLPFFVCAVLTVTERPMDEVDEDEDDEVEMMPAGLYFFVADGLGFNSGDEFYRPCASVDEAKAMIAELTLENFVANAEGKKWKAMIRGVEETLSIASRDWIYALGWIEVPL